MLAIRHVRYYGNRLVRIYVTNFDFDINCYSPQDDNAILWLNNLEQVQSFVTSQ